MHSPVCGAYTHRHIHADTHTHTQRSCSWLSFFFFKWSFHHWIAIPTVQWWRTILQACGPSENTDWTKLRVCSQRGQLLIDLNWAWDSTLWYRPNWKATKTVARRVPRYAAPFGMSLLESERTLEILLHCNFLSVPVKLKPIGAWHRGWNKFFGVFFFSRNLVMQH